MLLYKLDELYVDTLCCVSRLFFDSVWALYYSSADSSFFQPIRYLRKCGLWSRTYKQMLCFLSEISLKCHTTTLSSIYPISRKVLQLVTHFLIWQQQLCIKFRWCLPYKNCQQHYCCVSFQNKTVIWADFLLIFQVLMFIDCLRFCDLMQRFLHSILRQRTSLYLSTIWWNNHNFPRLYFACWGVSD